MKNGMNTLGAKAPLFAALTCAALTLFAADQALDTSRERDWTITGNIQGDRMTFKANEEAAFSFFVRDAQGQPVRDGKIRLTVKKDGEPEKDVFKQLSEGNPILCREKLAVPGQIQIDAKAVESAPRGWGLYRKEDGKKKDIAFSLTAFAEPEKIAPGSKEPDDFDAFWAEQKKNSDALPPDVLDKTFLKETKEGVKVYSLALNSLGGPLYAEISFPKDAGADKKYPLWVIFEAYGVAPFGTWPWPDKITLAVNAHSMKNHGQTKEYYAEFQKKLKNYGFDKAENQKAETSYFYGMMMRDYRAVRYMLSLPECDPGKGVTFYGGSQGGFQALVMAGLIPETTSVSVHNPWGCDWCGMAAGRIKCWHPEPAAGLGYFDPCFHIKRTKARKIKIEAGAVDTACEGTGILALFNNIPAGVAAAELRMYQATGHASPKKGSLH